MSIISSLINIPSRVVDVRAKGRFFRNLTYSSQLYSFVMILDSVYSRPKHTLVGKNTTAGRTLRPRGRKSREENRRCSGRRNEDFRQKDKEKEGKR